MKTSTFVIAALFASVQATESACHASGIAGVTCGPSDVELFATGMNGDEDLGEDITMKGDKFHFIQNENVQLEAEPAAKASGTGIIYSTAGYSEPDKVHTLDPKITKAHSTFSLSQAEPAAKASGTGIVYSTVGYSEPDKVHTLDPKITKAHSTFSLSQAEPAANATAGAKADYPAPEKVHTLDPKIAKAHTTFYGKQLSQAEPATEAPVAAKADYPAPEKVHTLDPKIAKAHTTFYNQQKGALIEINGIPKNENKDSFTGVKDFPYPGPEQVHTLDPKTAGAHTTFYNKK